LSISLILTRAYAELKVYYSKQTEYRDKLVLFWKHYCNDMSTACRYFSNRVVPT